MPALTRRAWAALALAGLLLAASLPFVVGGAGPRIAAFLVDPTAPAPLPAPPSIRLDAPAPGEGVGPSVALAGEARSDSGSAVQDVELRVDGGRWTSLPDAPRGAAVEPFEESISLDPGDHLLEVRAWDGAAFSLPARALVRAGVAPPPTVAIVSPADGSGVPAGEVVVTGTLRNGPALVVVEAANQTLQATMQGATWFARVTLPPGIARISAHAIAWQESLPAVATVAVGGPSLAIASPSDGSAFGSSGDALCSGACIRFAGATSPDARAVRASLDGGPASDATLAGSAWTWTLPMDALVSGPHRVSFTPVAADGTEGVAREIAFMARTPREIAVVGDEAPRLTGTPLSFSLSGNATSARWTLDGADAGQGASVTVSLARPGPHELIVETRDAHGRSATVELPLLALDRAPAATLRAVAGLAVSDTPFEAVASDPDGSVVRYAWEFGDGATLSTSRPDATHRYASQGLYRANLTVFDDQGAASPVASVLVAIANAPPAAAFAFSPDAPSVFDDVAFLDFSRDPEGNLASRHWDFGDGALANVSNPTHRFATRGDHAVTLQVTDGDGATARATQIVHVVDLPIQPAFSWSPLAPRAGETVTFADASRKPDGPIVNRSWSFGATGALATHAFPAAGAYEVTLNLTDDLGQPASITQEIVVGDAAPRVRAIAAEPAQPLALQPVTLHALGNDALGTIASLSWDFGDGAASNETQPTHAWARSGRYVVTVVATGASNLTATANLTLDVADAAPVAHLSVETGPAGQLITLDASGSRDPDGHLARYVFDADGDGLPDCDGVLPRCSFAYPDPGLYLANLTVVDDEGATSSDAAPVTVLVPPPELAPPVVHVERPAPGDALAGQVVLSGTAGGLRSVRLVETQMRTGLRTLALGPAPWMQAQGSAGWSQVMDTTAFPDGSYTLVVRATDESGAQGFAFVPVEVRNGPQDSPLALHVANAPLEPVGADYDLEGSAYHPLGVSAVRWRLDDGPWRDPDGPAYAFTIPLRGLDPGLHVVLVDAFHGVSEKREARVEIRVAAPPPALVVDEPPGPLAYGLLHASGRAVGNGTVQWRLDTGVWEAANGTEAGWRLDEPTNALPAGPHELALRAVGPDGAPGELHAWRVEVVRALGDSRFSGFGADDAGRVPTPERRASLDVLAPLAAIAFGAFLGDSRRRL